MIVLISALPSIGIVIHTGSSRSSRDIEDAKSDALGVIRGLAYEHERAVESTRQFLMTLARVPDIKSLNAPASNKFLKELLKQNPAYGTLFVVNAQGLLHASGTPLPRTPLSFGHRKYYRDALRTRDFSVGEYGICPVLKRPVLEFAFPIIAERDQFKGVVAVSLDLARYAQMFPMEKLPDGSALSFGDQTGLFLYRYPGLEDHMPNADLPDMIKHMSVQPDEGVFTYMGVDGVRRLNAYRRFHLGINSSPYLFVCVGIPEEKALLHARKALLIHVGLLGVAFFVTVFSAWSLGNAMIVKRLRKLVEASRRLGHGDLKARTGLDHKSDELGEVGKAFDEMAEAIETKSAERKQAEWKLERIAYEWQTTFDSITDLVLILDDQCRIVRVNRACFRFLSLPVQSIIGNQVFQIFGTDMPPEQSPYERMMETKQHQESEIYLAEKGMWLSVSVDPILDGKGNVINIVYIAKDITDRKRTEKKLRESEEIFSQLAENIREVFYIYEPDTQRLCYVSPAYTETTGHPIRSLYDKPESFLDVIHPDDRNQVMKSLGKKIRGEVEELYRIVRSDGSIRWIKDHSFPIYDDSGKTLRFGGIASDITDMKLGEEKLKYLSLHDPLTGLYNRIYFDEEMNRIEKSRYANVGIVSCDVDGLKLVNDTLGHDKGDTLLAAAARVIRDSFRDGDLVARIGGDEFAILIPNTSAAAVEHACGRIQGAAASYNAAHPELPLSISVGFAVGNGGSKSLKEVLKEADVVMYRTKLHRTQTIRRSIVDTVINVLKARNLATEQHTIRLERLLTGTAAFMGLPEATKSHLSLLARFYDIGKVGVSNSILFKEARLTSEERTEMKRHCEVGYRIALLSPELTPIADWILKHHEWWNGQGYPLGIKGEEIPIECRLFAIAEAYEAMREARPYRGPFSHAEAVAELLRLSGIQFDPKLVETFLQMLGSHPSDLSIRALHPNPSN